MPGMNRALALFALPLAALAGCVHAAPPRSDGIVFARIGQTVSLAGLRLTPLRLVEDSRCPRGMTCVWSGQVLVAVRIAAGTARETREISTLRPIPVAGGMLELAEVQSPETAKAAIPPGDYRFGFRFKGGR